MTNGPVREGGRCFVSALRMDGTVYHMYVLVFVVHKAPRRLQRGKSQQCLGTPVFLSLLLLAC